MAEEKMSKFWFIWPLRDWDNYLDGLLGYRLLADVCLEKILYT